MTPAQTTRLCLLLVVFQVAKADENARKTPYLLDSEWSQLIRVHDELDPKVRGTRLLGSLETMLDLDAPDWWQRLIRAVDTGPRSANLILDKQGLRDAVSRWEMTSTVPVSGLQIASNLPQGTAVEVRIGEAKLKLNPASDWGSDYENWANPPNRGVAGCIARNRCFIAPKCPTEVAGGPPRLFCFDTSTGEQLWKTRLVRGFRFTYNNLSLGSFTEIKVHRDMVIIWTGSEIAATVQAFRIEDGTPVLRFASNGDRLPSLFGSRSSD